jgi:stage V sporulation protein G
MEITEVRVKLVEKDDDRLRAFCSMTFDREFVVRDIKIIEGEGGYFVAMPSRKLSDRCAECGGKNHLRARYCSNCGHRLPTGRKARHAKGRNTLHTDIAHPVNIECRRRIQERVVAAFEEELKKSKQPGYQPLEIDEPDDEIPEMADDARA